MSETTSNPTSATNNNNQTAVVDKYNVETAEILANEAQHLPISEAVPIYEQLLTVFPTAAKYWRQYLEAQMAVNNDEATKQIFSRCLLNCFQIPLWYAQTTQEESQRMTAVRKAYQKAIVTPTHHVEQLWKDYENFENSVSRALAKGLLSEYQSKYNSAKAVYREQKKYVDEIDWNMLAVPPTGTSKCLMYLYHYPDIWYDYATWHARNGSIDSAIKVFQRALKALPDTDMLRYAYAELEESRGAIQPAKKIYESLLGDGVNATALVHIQFIRFLRRTEGVEAARKYFLDARKSPNCPYHVFVAYAMMAFCLDKDPKVAHNVFEAGLKRFMHEPGYILEYADFLSRLNDDRNIRALFERALSSLPPEESMEVWKRFAQFEQTYGDLASMLKVEQRRKEALSRTGDDGTTALESSLQDVVSRYSFMDLWPCSSRDLDHLARQEWLAKNISKKVEKSAILKGVGSTEKSASGFTTNSNPATKVFYPDTSQMVVYDPRQKLGTGALPSTTAPVLPSISGTLSNSSVAMVSSRPANPLDEILKSTPPALVAFIANLPAVEGPSPDVDVVLSICLQSNVSTGQTGLSTQLAAGPVPSTSDLSGSSRSHPIPSGSSFKPMRDRQTGKRKDLDSMCPLYHFQHACYAYKIRNTLCLLCYKIGNIFFGHRCHLWEIFVIHFMNFNA
ncbi:hypothetical protein PVL29_014730 [Vitis rotundifolia]|uniref:Suppressor of forked domain-containing protein n=1 Tax=Vitis rotundifolia TaxID=103349 RepID=A0AA39DLI6_VITRO|nr:hypothetical protein PVL29_014730 [Vitis rotundifolia]